MLQFSMVPTYPAVSPGIHKEISALETGCRQEAEDKVGFYAITLFFAFSELIPAKQRTFIKIKFFIIFLLLLLLLSTV